MPKYRVNWRQEVIQNWTGTVEAESEEEDARWSNGDISNEELCDETGVRARM